MCKSITFCVIISLCIKGKLKAFDGSKNKQKIVSSNVFAI